MWQSLLHGVINARFSSKRIIFNQTCIFSRHIFYKNDTFVSIIYTK